MCVRVWPRVSFDWKWPQEQRHSGSPCCGLENERYCILKSGGLMYLYSSMLLPTCEKKEQGCCGQCRGHQFIVHNWQIDASLFRKKMLMLDDKFQRSASKFAIFYINPKVDFTIFMLHALFFFLKSFLLGHFIKHKLLICSC